MLCTSCENKIQGPVLKVEQKTIDFGNVNKSENLVIRNSITLINRGSEDLIVKDISPSCDCVTIYGIYPDTIAPGKKSIVDVSVDLTNEEGRMGKKIYVRTNDKEKVEIIHILANITDWKNQLNINLN